MPDTTDGNDRTRTASPEPAVSSVPSFLSDATPTPQRTRALEAFAPDAGRNLDTAFRAVTRQIALIIGLEHPDLDAALLGDTNLVELLPPTSRALGVLHSLLATAMRAYEDGWVDHAVERTLEQLWHERYRARGERIIFGVGEAVAASRQLEAHRIERASHTER